MSNKKWAIGLQLRQQPGKLRPPHLGLPGQKWLQR